LQRSTPGLFQRAQAKVRPWLALTCICALLSVANTGLAKDTKGASPEVSSEEEHHWLGVALELGVPDVLGVSLAVSPWYWLRLQAGVITNLLAPGVRGSLTLVPFNFGISPSLTVEGGHMFDGDANKITRRYFGIESAVLERIGYSYTSAHLGLEFGDPNGFSFYLRAGITYAVAKVHNLQQVLQEETADSSITFKDPTFSYLGPSAKLGFILFFL